MNRRIEWILMPISVAVVLAVAIVIIKTARADEKLWLDSRAASEFQKMVDCNDWVLLMGYCDGYDREGKPRIVYFHYTARETSGFLTDDFSDLSSRRFIESAAYFHLVVRH